MGTFDRIPQLNAQRRIVDANGIIYGDFQSWLNRNFSDIYKALVTADQALLATVQAGDDGKLTPIEKKSVVKPSYATITAEQSDIDSKATLYGITTEKTNYDTALAALTTYLATLTTPVAWNNTTGNTDVDRTTWDAKWGDLRVKRQLLLNRIDAVAGTTANWSGVTGGGKPEDSADITRWIDAPAQSTVFNFSYTGSAEAGQFSRDIAFKLIAPSGQITTGITWTGRILTGGFNGVTSSYGVFGMTNISGAGILTVASLESSSCVVEVKATVGGRDYVRTVELTKKVADPPTSSTGGGGGTASPTTIAGTSGPYTSFSNTTAVDVTGALVGTIPTGKSSATIYVGLNAKAASGATGGWTVECKVMRDVAGTPTQIGSDTASSNWIAGDFSGDEAMFNFSVNDTGLSAGTTYTWRIYMRLTSGARSHSVTGGVSVVS